MKPKFSYIFILILLSLLPRFAQATEAKQNFIAGHSFQRSDLQSTAALSAATLNLNDVVAADLDVDDEDFSLSAKKRIAFERTAHFAAAYYIARYISAAPQHSYRSPHNYQLSSSRFISLRVFRI